MDRELLDELEEAFDRLSCGLSAMKLMTFGLEDVRDPNADGFFAVWSYLDQTGEELRRLLERAGTVEVTA